MYLSRIILLCCLLPILAVAAPVYKWLDSTGVTHYTQEPPTQGNVQILTPQITPGLAPEQAQQVLDAMRKKITDDNAAHAQAQSDQAQAQETNEERERRCTESRTRLEDLKNSRRVAIKDAQGEYRRIDDDERAGLIAQVEATIQKECNP